MSANTAQKRKPSHKSNSEESFDDILSKKASQEIVIGLCGPVGCGIKDVTEKLENHLTASGYKVVSIRVSDLMQSFYKLYHSAYQSDKIIPELSEFIPSPSEKTLGRITKLQNLGNYLRNNFDLHFCAQLAINSISKWREDHPTLSDDPDKIATTERTAFIINQLKNPNEAQLLQEVYGNIFYLVGVLANDDKKIQRLKSLGGSGITEADAYQLISRDRKDDESHGQQLEKTMLYCDYYISYNSENLPRLNSHITRFINLCHNANGITPTLPEIGMYSAYSASLQSACLSRQVGAAICDDAGNILATGRNDVPKFGGGLYRPEDGDNDFRCIKKGEKCYNTEKINKLKYDIGEVIFNSLNNPLLAPGTESITKHKAITHAEAQAIAQKIADDTTVGSLIEFSRSIHAEMDAIVSLSRKANCSTEGATIYTTTFPCHNCARHIVASGIKKVIYIEPYEKSQAIELHEDSITKSEAATDKVIIQPFEGVSPQRFQQYFKASQPRKDKTTGQAIIKSIEVSVTNERAILSKYTQIEDKIAQRLSAQLGEQHAELDTSM
ncbi:anti-phage dCTP deaminase [Zhongshania aquimaris]|uniref:CMP/dCMP-type deaminase domain-containing protein n=1 Tax=Zhongshania aquimaris TaxID=2857107 RepID=A0ABS6VQH0_9GAMM|nr:anti-phage dCTP deaminase [Zhongshania aquimaris]MBW2940506.1 hypothetical protein [Zhongshania aquimaris]